MPLDPHITKTRAALGIDDNQAFGSLADLVRAAPALCERAGINMAHVVRSPEASITSIATGLAALGKMMANNDTARELSESDLVALGDLIATAAELIPPLQDLERANTTLEART